jgi:hypothetical protein
MEPGIAETIVAREYRPLKSQYREVKPHKEESIGRLSKATCDPPVVAPILETSYPATRLSEEMEIDVFLT